MSTGFPSSPAITLYDPLADLLGVGDGQLTYTFEDAVKLSGHACPTVAGAFLMAIQGLRELYGGEIPRRGEVSISISGEDDQGVNGPISQVFTLLTGAAGNNGFHGLAGQHARRGLMKFNAGANGPFIFTRVDTGQSVHVSYDPSGIASDPRMLPLLQMILEGDATPSVKQQFARMWRDRVVRILEDSGKQTITVTRSGSHPTHPR